MTSQDTQFKKGLTPWNKGKTGLQKHTEEWKRNMSEKMKGGNSGSFKKGHMPINGFKMGQKGSFKGKQHSEETKKQMSISRLGLHSGENHYKWKKDRTQVVQSEKKHLSGLYKEWMLKVKKRDNWKCKIAHPDCKGRLEAHHILNWKDYPELRYEINNGITLCHAHHPRGRKNEAKLSPYLQSLVAEMK